MKKKWLPEYNMPDNIEIRKLQEQAFMDGYCQCQQDLQNDMDENVILTEVVFEYVDAKKRTAEYMNKLGGNDGRISSKTR